MTGILIIGWELIKSSIISENYTLLIYDELNSECVCIVLILNLFIYFFLIVF